MRLSLARLRFPVERSRGRRYPEPPHPYRNEFQRDRDRIVHARAFRRLEDKTQVFAAGLSDHFRNRLTHTIEVSQIARTVAAVLELDEDLTEALALAHDIGHPPFAHAGEEELDRLMRGFGDRFEHNLHALRIVETFEQRYARFPGLNLTFEVREGIVKHSRDLEPGEAPELEEYLPGLRPPLEAQLIDLADEIAYNTADLDDGFSAGLFRLEDVAACSPLCRAVLEEIETQFPGAPERTRFHEALRRWIDLLVSGLIQGTFEAAEGCGARDPDDVRRQPQRLARFTPEAFALNRDLKQFLHRHVYFTESVMEERRRSRAMLAGLFHHFLEHPEDLPGPYQERMAWDPPHRVVCDYIAGMTDGFLRRTYQRLVGVPA
ncbi:MAG TPA: deoxyguanosinetriphosphate triphosphohydrolase [Bryobacteraceae bacterium]|nr:deoxyguanosinetriphosphate triphosphohydrolase [Bryobacteraceae bacterium]